MTGQRRIEALPVTAMMRTPSRWRLLEKRQHFMRLAALRDEDGDIASPDDPQITVHAVGGVQECRRSAGRGQRRGDLPAHQTRLPHAGDNDSSRRASDQVDCVREAVVEPALECMQRLSLRLDHRASPLNDAHVRIGTVHAGHP